MSAAPAHPSPLQNELWRSLDQGILVPADGQQYCPQHRADEYDESGFDLLLAMQRDHFWYSGRHKLLLKVLQRECRQRLGEAGSLRAIDIGGGCGGWLEYLHAHGAARFSELALGDSSVRALSLAKPVVGHFAKRYQVDLLNLAWSQHWDVVFLLDVLEHIPDHAEVLRQVRKSLRPGGLLFVTTPALNFFWTYNDELAHHQRRYNKQDFVTLAKTTDLNLVRADYFMFFLSPALLLSRWLTRPAANATPEQQQATLARTHRIPAAPVNGLLKAVLATEAGLVNHIKFPWGTSILSVFQRC